MLGTLPLMSCNTYFHDIKCMIHLIGFRFSDSYLAKPGGAAFLLLILSIDSITS